ncbi:MAG: hypothetical protein ACR2LR_02430 [Hassallia sp.]
MFWGLFWCDRTPGKLLPLDLSLTADDLFTLGRTGERGDERTNSANNHK